MLWANTQDGELQVIENGCLCWTWVMTQRSGIAVRHPTSLPCRLPRCPILPCLVLQKEGR
jgi:hypothetical protein